MIAVVNDLHLSYGSPFARVGVVPTTAAASTRPPEAPSPSDVITTQASPPNEPYLKQYATKTSSDWDLAGLGPDRAGR